jgi:hypothetical protein
MEPKNETSLKVKIPFRILSVVFALIAVFTLLTAGLAAYQGFYGRLVMYGAYAAINFIIAFGFWKMKKWILSIFVVALAAVTLFGIIGLIAGTKELTQFFTGILVVGVFSGVIYFLRSHLNGEYRQYKVLGSFFALLALAQIAIAILK